MATARKAASSAKGYLVTAPLVQATLNTGTPLQFRDGDILPDGVSQESLDHLLDLGYIAKGDVPESGDE